MYAQRRHQKAKRPLLHACREYWHQVGKSGGFPLLNTFRFPQLKVRECGKCRRKYLFHGRQQYAISTPARQDINADSFGELKDEDMPVKDPKRSLESVPLIYLLAQKFGKHILNPVYCSFYALEDANHPLVKVPTLTAPQVS